MRELLAQGKWRQARDELKSLVKLDRARFLPLLIDANLGLGRKMLAGGQMAEARQVANYLATIAPAGRLRAFELELAGKSAASEESLPAFIAALTDPGVVLSAEERVRFADAAVLAFQPVTASDAASAALAAEVGAVHAALQAVAEARWPDVPAALRLIPHRSAVSHWAVFIKGIAAFYRGESSKAAKLLCTLPPRSAPARAGHSYLVLLGEASGAGSAGLPAEPARAGALRLAGAGRVSTFVLRAEAAWRAGRHVESYRALRDAVPEFPAQTLDVWGALSEFYFKVPHSLPDHEWRKFLRHFCELIDADDLKNGVESMLAHRLIALMGATFAPVEDLRTEWDFFLRAHEALHGSNPRLASLAQGWLGEQLARPERAGGFSPGRRRLRDARGAIAAFNRSIELDPANRAAHLQLCAVYELLKKSGERNRLLDTMTARFPDDKQVLVQAARGCIERQAFGKGLAYLARARQLDQLDPLIPELLLAALHGQARQQFQQRRPDKARQTLAQGEAWLTGKADDFQRSRWTALIRQGLMERFWGEGALAAALLAQARTLAPSPAAHALFVHLTHRSLAKADGCESPFLGELKATLKRGPRLGDIGLLVRLLDDWEKASGPLRAFHEKKMIGESMVVALKQPFTRTEALDLLERTHGERDYARPLRLLVEKVLRDDPADPFFQLWSIEFNPAWRDPAGRRAELQSILEEAGRRHEEAAMRKARQMLHDIDQPPRPDWDEPGEDEGDDYVDDTDDDADAGEAGDSGPDWEPAFDLPPGARAEFDLLFEQLRNATPAVIGELRKASKRDMPPGLFDLILGMAKSGIPLPLPPLPRPPAPKPAPPKPLPPPPPPPPMPCPKPTPPAPPPSEPNQLNLF